MFPFKEPEAVKKTLTFELEKAAEAETQVKINFDEAYVAEYNYLNKPSSSHSPKRASPSPTTAF